MVLPFSSPSLNLLVVIAGPEETKNQRGKSPPPDSDPFSDAEFEKIMPAGQAKKSAIAYRHRLTARSSP